jgi:predicted RNase H-like nuclease
MENLKSQIATSSWGGRRTLPYVFTEQGVAMLSSVLKSKVAINVNIQIIRVFTKIREMLLTHKDLLIEMEEIRKKVSNQDEKIELIFNYLKQFIQKQESPRTTIGYKQKTK